MELHTCSILVNFDVATSMALAARALSSIWSGDYCRAFCYIFNHTGTPTASSVQVQSPDFDRQQTQRQSGFAHTSEYRSKLGVARLSCLTSDCHLFCCWPSSFSFQVFLR